MEVTLNTKGAECSAPLVFKNYCDLTCIYTRFGLHIMELFFCE
jgi:hypothetical protein